MHHAMEQVGIGPLRLSRTVSDVEVASALTDI